MSGLKCSRQFHRFGAVRSFSQNLEVGFGLEQPPQTVAEDRMVIGNHDANRLRFFKIHEALPRREAQ